MEADLAEILLEGELEDDHAEILLDDEVEHDLEVDDEGAMENDLVESPIPDLPEAIAGEVEDELANSPSLLSLTRMTPLSTEKDLVNQVNALRKAGFRCPGGQYFAPISSTLRWDCRFFRAARKWSVEMANKGFVAHKYGGSTPGTRLAAEGYSGAYGENIAAGQSGTSATLKQWKNSDKHCKVMMNPNYNRVGQGYTSGGQYRHYWTMKFGKDSTRDTGCLR